MVPLILYSVAYPEPAVKVKLMIIDDAVGIVGNGNQGEYCRWISDNDCFTRTPARYTVLVP